MIPKELQKIKKLSGQERLGQNRESEYLGAEDIDPGTEPIVTIEGLYNGMVTLQRGKENKDVIAFQEESVPGIKNVRPLIVNATNRKTLRKLYGSVSADTLTGKRIQLFIDHNVRDPSDGSKVDGIRIRAKVPPTRQRVICQKCGKEITPAWGMSVAELVQYGQTNAGATLCKDCLKAAADSGSPATEPQGTTAEVEHAADES